MNGQEALNKCLMSLVTRKIKLKLQWGSKLAKIANIEEIWYLAKRLTTRRMGKIVKVLEFW